MTKTADEYTMLDNAYQYFNQTLFGGELPDALIVISRKKKNFRGHYIRESFESRLADEKIDEIGLNAESFKDRTDKSILSTLVHEMTHLWQYHFGKPARGGYHDRQWGKKMEEIGLMPSNTSAEGGKKTGQQMSHYIIPNGPFEIACDKLLENNHVFSWNCFPFGKIKRPQSKVKYTCPTCNQNAWAKPTAELMCGNCQETMESN